MFFLLLNNILSTDELKSIITEHIDNTERFLNAEKEGIVYIPAVVLLQDDSPYLCYLLRQDLYWDINVSHVTKSLCSHRWCFEKILKYQFDEKRINFLKFSDLVSGETERLKTLLQLYAHTE
jgi:hypothetical protein